VIWLTWRQHRAEAGVGAALVAALAAALVVIGRDARRVAEHLGLPACAQSDCSSALERLHQHYHWLPPVTATLVALPLLAGMFWGAPLISREYEAGTHRLAWTQSVSRFRWMTDKLALILSATTIAAVALGLVAVWALTPLAPAFGTRYNSTWFDIQGFVPAACMLFALSAGIAASATTRRTIPAMVVTLLAYATARFPVHFFRGHAWGVRTHSVTFPLTSLLQDPDSDFPPGLGTHTLSLSDWILSTTRLDPAGHVVSQNLNNRGILINYCPDLPPRGDIGSGPFQACATKLGGLTGRVVTEYQPASHFWSLQILESLVFLTLAAALVALSILVVVRRRSI
jgi:hypothetical protein